MSLFSINKVYLLGNITKDITLKTTPNNNDVCNFSVATNQSVKDGDGYKDIPTYHNIVAWGGVARVASKLGKGDKVAIEGKITNRSYEKDGRKIYVTEILAEKVIGFSKGNSEATQEEVAEALGVDSQTAQDIADEVPF